MTPNRVQEHQRLDFLRLDGDVMQPRPRLDRRVAQRCEAAHTNSAPAMDLIQPIEQVTQLLRDLRSVQGTAGCFVPAPCRRLEVRPRRRPVARLTPVQAIVSDVLSELGEPGLKKRS